MKNQIVLFNGKNRMITIIAVLLLATSSFVRSQDPVNLSGKWILNNGKSSVNYTNLSSTVIISQVSDRISFEITNTPKNGQPETTKQQYVMGEGLGGRSSINNLIRLADWSPDKQSIFLTSMTTFYKDGVLEEWKQVTDYSLTDGGKTMIVESKHFPLEGNTAATDRNTIMVYDKSM